ncbi:MAG: lipopolysaccharide biosynthesis protein [Bacteroidota bacterium]
MTNAIRRLAGQTAIYGISSIVGRLLNYLLVPVYTNYFLTHEFGVIAVMYSYVAILIVILTHGMETAFFRFSEQQPDNKARIFGTALLSVFAISFVFVLTTTMFSQPIADLLRYPDHPEYVLWFGIIIGLDALMSIPFARLRAENKPIRFAIVKLAGIGVNILLVLFFVVFSPWIIENHDGVLAGLINRVYNPDVGVGYVFISNLVASSITALLLLPVIFRGKFAFSAAVWKPMILYAFPLLIAGLAGILNEALDKILLVYLLPEETAMSMVGIYGACYRVSVLMVLFIQAFRFAAEPFFFAEYKNENAKELYARVMKVFVVTCLFIFLGIMLYMDVIQYFIGKDFREGLDVVPILLMAHIFLGIYFNLSIWYKLTGQTRFGAYIAVIGAGITILFNILLIPLIGYYASAWAHLVCYFCMTLISWYWGQKHFPVSYDIPRIILFIAAALVLYWIHGLIPDLHRVINWLISALMLAAFAVAVLAIDAEARETLRPLLKKIPAFKNL